ncbi:MDR family MFS transporter [Streptomyces solisilvae]|uniref:MDR family MFS transporter n=1 Tax=Streptomyces malaysiensis TaxID=92644 RepID=UPI003682C964
MPPRQVLQAVSGLVAGLFVAILAGTVVANALPRITAELGASQSSYTWVIIAELLAMTATVPLWGKLSDLYSKKVLLQISLGLFVVGSLVAGFSQGAGMLIFSRVVQGLGAGGLTALTQVVMAAVIPPRKLGRYSGVFGAVYSGATVAGPLIGGLLVDTSWLGWRWCFFIGVPFALLAIALLQRTLHLPHVRRDVKIDWLGAFLIVAGVSPLLIWVSMAGSTFDWFSWQTAALVGGGTLLLAAAVRVESRAAEPIIPLSIFRIRTVALTSLASLLAGVGLFGGTVFLSQFFQVAMGKSPTTAGLMSLPLILGSLTASTFAGHRISATGRWKRYLVAGTVLMTAGLALLSTIGSHTPFVLLSVYMAVLGTGVGMLMQNLVLAAQNDVPANTLGSATSVLSFSRSMGGTVGTSVLGAVLAHRVATELSAGGAAGGDTPGGGAGHGVPEPTTLPAPLRALVENAYGTATAELFLWATPFALLALIVVLFIEEKPLKTTTSTERLAEESAIATGGRVLPAPADTPPTSPRGRPGAVEEPPGQGSVPSGPGGGRNERGRNSRVAGTVDRPGHPS